MPWTRPALLLTLTWGLQPCVPARPEATALEVTPFAFTLADLEAEALVLHASAAGLAAERSRPIDLPFGRSPPGGLAAGTLG